jgi:hypothetical protein
MSLFGFALVVAAASYIATIVEAIWLSSKIDGIFNAALNTDPDYVKPSQAKRSFAARVGATCGAVVGGPLISIVYRMDSRGFLQGWLESARQEFAPGMSISQRHAMRKGMDQFLLAEGRG